MNYEKATKAKLTPLSVMYRLVRINERGAFSSWVGKDVLFQTIVLIEG